MAPSSMLAFFTPPQIISLEHSFSQPFAIGLSPRQRARMLMKF